MAHSVVLSDGTTSVTLTADVLMDADDLNIDREATTRTIAIRTRQTAANKDALWQAINVIERLLNEAAIHRATGLGRRLSLTIQFDGATLPTIFDVLRGEIAERPPVFAVLHERRHRYEPFTLLLDVEPFARTTEATLFSSGSLYGLHAGMTHRYVHHTGASAFSVNMVALIDGSLWQTTKFTASPTTVAPQNGDILYWGNSIAQFDRIVMGIRTAASGTWTGVWEYWNGSAWTTLTTASTFRTTREFDTAASLGAITWTIPGDWATTTINSVSSTYWVRYRISAFTSMATVPVMTNGPVRSNVGIAAIGSTDVDGDVPAGTMVHLTNPGSSALAGVRAAVATGFLSDYPPPFIVGLTAADLFVASGDSTMAVAADSHAALGGERVEATLAASLSDRAQDLSGSINITASVSSSDKIDDLGDASFFIEVMFKLDTVPSDPFPLVSRWTNSSTTACWWFGVDQGKLRAIVYNSNSTKKTVNAGTALQAGRWYLATFEFNASDKRLNLYLDTDLEKSADSGKNALRNGQTTAIRLGQSVSFATADSRDGSSAETGLDGQISYVWIQAQTLETVFGSGYPGPDAKRTTEGYASTVSANTAWFLEMEDNTSSTTIADSATSAKNAARSSGNSEDHTTVGYFQGGVGSLQKLLGIRLPTCLGEEYGGDYRVLLAVKPNAAITLVSDIEWGLQLNIGDEELGFVTAARQHPAIAKPTNGYYLLDFGAVRLPPAGPYQGHRGSGSARTMLTAYLYARHAFVTSTVMQIDCLYFLPLGTWYGEYDTFRSTYSTSYDLDQNTGVLFDNRGPEPVVAQTTTGGYTVQDRNPYARHNGARPRLHPRRPAWLFAIPMRAADSSPDYLFRGESGDILTPRVAVSPRYRVLASP